MEFEHTCFPLKGHGNQGKVFKERKKANVTCNFKNGKKEEEMENQRLVSLTSVLGSGGANRAGSYFQTYEGQTGSQE